jgi:hypothetical protein
MSCTTRFLSDPEMSHLQPASPGLAQHPTKHITALTAQNKVDREILAKPVAPILWLSTPFTMNCRTRSLMKGSNSIRTFSILSNL